MWSEALDLSLFAAAASSVDPVVDTCEAGGSASLCAAWDFGVDARNHHHDVISRTFSEIACDDSQECDNHG